MRPGAVYHKPPTKPARAFTLTDLLLILASVAILAVILLPVLARSTVRPSKISCANNVKQIGLAFRTWAIDNDDRFPMQVSVTNGGSMELAVSGQVFPHFQVMSNELVTPKILVCPNDEDRTYATNFTAGISDTNISYFVNLDSMPGDGSSLLCGDRNLTNNRAAGGRFILFQNRTRIGWTKDIHSKKGNLCFGDGRVDEVANGRPHTMVKLPEGVTNRLAIP